MKYSEYLIATVFCLCIVLGVAGSDSTHAQDCIQYQDHLNWISEFGGLSHENVTIQAGLTFVVGSHGLDIFDITNPETPENIGSVELSTRGNGIVVHEDFAFVAAGNPYDYLGSLVIINTSSLEAPFEVQSVPTTHDALAVALSEGHAVVTTGWDWTAPGTLLMVEISLSGGSQSHIVGSVELPDAGLDVSLSGDLAFVAVRDFGIFVIDISVPSAPAVIGASDLFPASAVKVRDGFAYVAAESSGLVVFDVSTPSNPVVVSQLPTGGVAKDLTLAGDLLYLADDQMGFLVVDIADHSAPVQLGGLNYFDAKAVATNSDHAVVVEGNGRLHVLDLTVLNSAASASGLSWNDDALSIAISADHAYLADGDSGMQIIDISDPLVPQIVNTVDTAERAFGLTVTDDHAYVLDLWPSVLYIVDIIDPLAAQIVGSLDFPGRSGLDVTVAGDYAYISATCDGLPNCEVLIVDISWPTQPQIVGTLPNSGYAAGIAVAGNFAFVAANNTSAGLQIFDITDPTAAQLVGSVNPGLPRSVIVKDSWAYLASAWGLMIIDISAPTNPKIVSTVDTPGSVYDVAIMGSYAYLADRIGGLQVVDVSDPHQPRLVGGMATPGHALGVAVAGQHAFLADRGNGLEVAWLQCEPPSAVEYDEPSVTARFHVRPNPFNPRVAVSFSLDRPQQVRCAVYNLAGHRLAVLVDEEVGAGEHTVRWDGRDSTGKSLASGTYFLRLEAGEEVQTEKIALIR